MFNPTQYFDEKESDFFSIFENIKQVWNILPELESFILKTIPELGSEYREYSKDVWVGKNTEIADTATVTGPAIIGHNCEIRHSAFIRGKVVIGNGVVVGNSCEIKNSFIFNNAQIPHFNYVGDSILGHKAHIGAGVILSNVKSIPGNVNVTYGENKIDTGLRKFSAILADKTEVGCNSVLNPGTIIGRESVVYPLSNVRGVIPEKCIYKNSGVIVNKK